MLSVLIRALVLLVALAAEQAWGAAIVNSITLNGAAPPISVDRGQTITVSLNVTTTGTGSNGRWRSTGYSIGGGTEVCIDVPSPNNAEVAGTYTRSFNIQVPATNGTYDFSVSIYGGDSCNALNGSATSPGAIIVGDPSVVSIVRIDPSPTNASTVRWTVTFDRSVTGVDATDFSLAVSGLTGTSITSVTGSGTTYTVTANTGTGTGTLGLNLVDNDSIQSANGFKLGGTGAGNGNFTGEVYTIDRTAPTVTKSFSPSGIAVNGTSTLTIAITNSQTTSISGVAFADTYPGGGAVKNAATPGLTNSCGGVAAAVAGGTTLALVGGTIAGSSTCSVSVTVTATAAGSYTNSTGNVTATNATTSSGASAMLAVGITVSSFNVVEPGADPVTGKILTKIAAQNFALQIVALDASSAVATSFTGTVSVELVDNSGGGACNTLPSIASFANQTFVAGDSGRHTLSGTNTVSSVWRNAKIRITYAPGSIVRCSGDNFAIRPADFVVVASHADRLTAGNTALNTTDFGGTQVHNAGRPFKITVTARRGDGSTSTDYDPSGYGGVSPSTGTCAAAACTATIGTLSAGGPSWSSGVMTTTNASYNEVGAFRITYQDATFASVDAADVGASYTIQGSMDVGRFVPDRFAVSGGSITPRSELSGPACAASTFTYLGEPLTVVFTLTAVNASGLRTQLYDGAWARLALTDSTKINLKAMDASAPTALTSRIDTSLIAGVSPAPAWSAGLASGVALPIIVNRGAGRDGPFNSAKIGIAPSDLDGVTATYDLDTDNDAAFDSAQVATTSLRYGRLRIIGNSGAGNVRLPVQVRAEYWDSATSVFVANGSDSCTAINRSQVAMNFTGLGSCATAFATPVPSITLASGAATWWLSAPGASASGAVDMRVNLNGATGSACTPGSIAAGTATMPFLQYRWTTSGGGFTDDPIARATFGTYGQDRLPNNVIFRRENF